MTATTGSVETGYLSLRGLAKRFGSQTAVDGLSLDIRRGEFVSLLGPSGCGKTTTLHMIAGFLRPDGGDIVLDGTSLRDVPTHQRGAAMVFQNYALFPHMTVFDNIAFGLRMAKVGNIEIKRRVGQVLDLVHLPLQEKRLPRELSGGQQQRVALARAVVLNPRLLLLDEPLSNLDAKLRKELRSAFVEVHRATGMTTLLVTHDLEEAFATSDRVAVLGEGKLQQFDTPRGIYTRPSTRFVSDFVGHVNVIEGKVSHRAEGYGLELGGTHIAIPEPRECATSERSSEWFRYAIPSHALQIAAHGKEHHKSYRAHLLRLNYLGATIQFELTLGDVQLVGESAAGGWVDGLAIGSEVFVDWPVAEMIQLP